MGKSTIELLNKIYFKMKFAIVLLGLFLIAEAAVVEDAVDDLAEEELDIEVRRARPRDCRCPKLNSGLECKKNQKKNKFYTDDRCKCPHYRCIWTICPEIVKPKCQKCQKLVEVEDCGCKSFECQNVQPNHCELKPVECKKCEKLEQTKDECGCAQEKCVPLQNPPSQCGKCNPCEKCVGIPTGIEGCGLKEQVCKRIECPHFKELKCDPDCEEPEFGETPCGCPFMKCKKLSPLQDIPQCKPCHELRKIKIEKCGIEKFQCVPSPCKGPPAGKEVCYKSSEMGDTDKCGCKTFDRKKCDVVPAGDCPEGSTAQGGSDLCGCPHQVCVPCSQMYPDPKCKECETKEKVKVGDGQCEQTKCVETPKCKNIDPCVHVKKIKQERRCPKCEKRVTKEMGPPGEGCMVKVCVLDLDNPKCRPCLPAKPVSCGICEKPKDSVAADGCKVKVCVPSDDPECTKPPPCPNKEGKPNCDSCQKTQKVKLWSGCYKETCVPKSARECEEHVAPKCPACQTAVSEIDECGCPKFTCKRTPCKPASKDDIVCTKDQKKKYVTVGLDKCQCPTPTCVNQKEICEDDKGKKGKKKGE